MNVSGQRKWYLQISYLGFSVGCAIAWGVIWILLALLASPVTVHRVGYVFARWVIGWATATIARVVYPAPRSTLFSGSHSN
jgi:predicted lysophospholipase L1 biosynthesis ABC-type transport system permease subunit